MRDRGRDVRTLTRPHSIPDLVREHSYGLTACRCTSVCLSFADPQMRSQAATTTTQAVLDSLRSGSTDQARRVDTKRNDHESCDPTCSMSEPSVTAAQLRPRRRRVLVSNPTTLRFFHLQVFIPALCTAHAVPLLALVVDDLRRSETESSSIYTQK